jgi:hypothetical protein
MARKHYSGQRLPWLGGKWDATARRMEDKNFRDSWAWRPSEGPSSYKLRLPMNAKGVFAVRIMLENKLIFR